MFFLDLDRFKLVNESLGHEVGDGLLREVATRLTELVRSDTVARLGGDEFMLLCPEVGSEREAVLIAERLSGGLAEGSTGSSCTWERASASPLAIVAAAPRP